jgi:hypothetical protein
MNNQDEKKDTFALTERGLTRVIVLLLIGAFLIFVAGYYVGKKRMCEELLLRDELVFAGKVQSALTSLAGRSTEDGEAEVEEVSGEEETATTTEATEDDASAQGDSASMSKSGKAYARLCGFATEAAAREYASRLGKRGVSVRVVERLSQTRRGKQVKWFQVVTETMERARLDALLEGIAKNDKLTDVTIVDLAE